MILWSWLVVDGWKSHAVPSYLRAALVSDLQQRPEQDGHPLVFEETPTNNVAIDLPGMAAMGRPWMTFQIDGLSVEIPCDDVGTMTSMLQRAPRRTFKGTDVLGGGLDYYKFHGFHRCIILTPDLYTELLGKLEAGYEEAEEKAVAFFESRKDVLNLRMAEKVN